MAFEQLNKFIEAIRTEYMQCGDDIRKSIEGDDACGDEAKTYRKGIFNRQSILFEALRIYYETVLQHAKFKGQRIYCRSVMEELEPFYCEGYFKTKKAKS